MSVVRTLLVACSLLASTLSAHSSPAQNHRNQRSLRQAVKSAREVHVYDYTSGPKGAWKKKLVAVLNEHSHADMFRLLKERERFGWAVARTNGAKRVPDFSFVFVIAGEPALEAAYNLGSHMHYYGNARAGGPFQACDIPVAFKRWVRTLDFGPFS